MARILLVDDDIAEISAVKRVLARGGHQPVLATNGRQALGTISSAPPDLLLVSSMCAGGEALRRLAEDGGARAIPMAVIGESADAPPGAALLSRPIDPDQLAQGVAAALAAPRAEATSGQRGPARPGTPAAPRRPAPTVAGARTPGPAEARSGAAARRRRPPPEALRPAPLAAPPPPAEPEGEPADPFEELLDALEVESPVHVAEGPAEELVAVEVDPTAPSAAPADEELVGIEVEPPSPAGEEVSLDMEAPEAPAGQAAGDGEIDEALEAILHRAEEAERAHAAEKKARMRLADRTVVEAAQRAEAEQFVVDRTAQARAAEQRAREEERARAEAEERAHKEAVARAREERARAEAERRAREKEQARLEAESRAREEERARAEAEERARERERARLEAEKRARDEERARAEAEKRAREEERARDEAEKRAREEERARAEAEKRAREEERARAEAEKRVREQERARAEAEKRAREETRRAEAEAAARAEAQRSAEDELERLKRQLDEERRGSERKLQSVMERARAEEAAAEELRKLEDEAARSRAAEEARRRAEEEEKLRTAIESARAEMDELRRRTEDEARRRAQAEAELARLARDAERRAAEAAALPPPFDFPAYAPLDEAEQERSQHERPRHERPAQHERPAFPPAASPPRDGDGEIAFAIFDGDDATSPGSETEPETGTETDTEAAPEPATDAEAEPELPAEAEFPPDTPPVTDGTPPERRPVLVPAPPPEPPPGQDEPRPASRAAPPELRDGTVAEVPLPRLIAIAARAELTGRVDFEGEAARSLWFEDGRIVGATSAEPSERVEELALRLGLVTRNQYRKIGQAAAALSSRRAALLLLERGFLKPTELTTLVRRRTEEVVFGIFADPGARFRFASEEVPQDERIALERPPLALAVEGVRRRWLAPRVDEVIGGPGTLLAPIATGPGPDDLGLSPQEKRVVALADGLRTLDEIVSASPLDALSTRQILSALVLVGSLAVRTFQGGRPASVASTAIDLGRVREKLEQVRRADYFTILGLGRLSTPHEIREAAERLLVEFDPTRYLDVREDGLEPRLAEIIRVVCDARDVLCDDRLREEYLLGLGD